MKETRIIKWDIGGTVRYGAQYKDKWFWWNCWHELGSQYHKDIEKAQEVIDNFIENDYCHYSITYIKYP